MSKIIEVKIPNIGGSDEASVAEVYIKVGDKIKKNDNLLMLETDKATMEVPSEYDGEVVEVLIKVGDKVGEGVSILKLNILKDELIKDNNIHETLSNTENQTKNIIINNVKLDNTSTNNNIIKQDNINHQQFISSHASPSIRKLARELGVDLSQIKGSSTKGRITENDLKLFVKSIMVANNHIDTSSKLSQNGLDILPWPKVDFAKYGEIEIHPLSRIKKLSGANLSRNWIMIPHVTQFDEADITQLEEFRKKLNQEYVETKITPLAFLIKACIHVLKLYPEFNSSLDGDNLIYKKYYHIGFAVDTPQGLVVPVLKDADKKGLIDIAKETSALASIARDGKLKPQDMQGSTFTISSLGGIGGTNFTPIINAPEVAILGVSKSTIKPIWNGNEFSPQLMLPLSLSYDHRVIDGALAVKFTSHLAKVLADIRRLVI